MSYILYVRYCKTEHKLEQERAVYFIASRNSVRVCIFPEEIQSVSPLRPHPPHSPVKSSRGKRMEEVILGVISNAAKGHIIGQARREVNKCCNKVRTKAGGEAE